MGIRSLQVEGVTWTVWRVTPQSPTRLARTGTKPAFREGWLVFESEAGKRRLAPVPEGWEECADAELAGHLGVAEPVPPRYPRGAATEA